jgi:hypothetical protein
MVEQVSELGELLLKYGNRISNLKKKLNLESIPRLSWQDAEGPQVEVYDDIWLLRYVMTFNDNEAEVA